MSQLIDKHAIWWEANKDRINEERRKARLENPDKFRQQSKRSRDSMTDEQKARKNEASKESYHRVKDRDKDSFLAKSREGQKIYATNNPDKVKETKAKHHAANKEKIAAKKKAYRLANPERAKELSKASRERNKEKRNAASRQWNAENADQYKEKLDQWKKENPEKSRVYSHNRKAQKRGNIGSSKLSNDLVLKLLKEQDGKCVYCAKSLNDKYHMDHIMPLSLGGAHADSNIQLLCAFCNMSKHNKHPDDFLQRQLQT